MKQWELSDIKTAHKVNGGYFFSGDTMRFFNSRISNVVFQGPGGIYFITSERYDSKSPRLYTVREFNPETYQVRTVGDFNELSQYQAKKFARQLSIGGDQ